MKGLKFVETLKITMEKEAGGQIITKEAYFNRKPHTIINNDMIQESLQISEEQLLNFIQQWISEGSNRLIKSIDGHYPT